MSYETITLSIFFVELFCNPILSNELHRASFGFYNQTLRAQNTAASPYGRRGYPRWQEFLFPPSRRLPCFIEISIFVKRHNRLNKKIFNFLSRSRQSFRRVLNITFFQKRAPKRLQIFSYTSFRPSSAAADN